MKQETNIQSLLPVQTHKLEQRQRKWRIAAMGADVSFYLEKYNKQSNSWEYAGAYNKEGKIVRMLYVRAHNYMPYIEEGCMIDSFSNPYTEVSEEIFEKYREHFDAGREEYDGIYKEGVVTLAELDRAVLKQPFVEDEWADDDELIEKPDGSFELPFKANPLKALYKQAYDLADMMSDHYVVDDRLIRLVFFCDN